MTITVDMERWTEDRFQGLNKDQLIAAGEILNVTMPRQTAEKTWRLKLCEAVGVQSTDESEVVVPPVVPMANLTRGPLFDPKPHLGVGARWGGKRHDCEVYQPPTESEESPKAFGIVWEGYKLDFPYNTRLHMPHPYYLIMKDSKKIRLSQKAIRDDEGVQIGVETTDIPQPRYQDQYYGPTPGTENLPESLCHYWQIQAKKHNNFRNKEGKLYDRRILQGIRSDLYGPVGAAYYKDLTNEDILYDILTFLFGDAAEQELAA